MLMFKSTRALSVLIALCLLIHAGILIADVTTGSIQQLSLSSSGGAPAGASGSPVVAPNGKVLAFRSSAENVVAGDDNRAGDIFLRDLKTGAVTLASVSSSGTQTNRASVEPAISPVAPDGMFALTFTSSASNLSSVLNPNFLSNIFLRVPALGLTEMVSFAPGAQQADGSSQLSSVTLLQNPSRVIVAFASRATNLGPQSQPDLNDVDDVYMASAVLPASGGFSDLASAFTITRVSNAPVSQPDGASSSPKISGDGRFIVFTSEASNLISDQKISGRQIYRYTLDGGKTELISKDSTGAPADGDCDQPSISFSGRFLTYISTATNLVSGGTSGKYSVILHDLVKGTVQRVNTSSQGIASGGDGFTPSVSSNGRFITFADDGENLVADDTDGVSDVFIKDLDTNTTVRASAAPGVQPDGASDSTSVSGDSYNALTGSLFFRSFARNLISGATTATGAGDIFSRSVTLSAPQLKKGSQIETPADVTIKGRRSTIKAQKFSFPVSTPAPILESEPAALAASSGARKAVNYQFQVQGTGKRRNVRQNLTSKRNTVTTAKLAPGVYNTRYRVVATKGSKVVSKTPFSPRQIFEIKG